MFVALLALDTRRLEQRRLDCLPCIRVPYIDEHGQWVHDDISEPDDDPQDHYYAPQQQQLLQIHTPDNQGQSAGVGGEPGGVNGVNHVTSSSREVGGAHVGRGHRGHHGTPPAAKMSLQSLLQTYMERVHAPLLMKPLVQVVVVAVFVTGARFDCPFASPLSAYFAGLGAQA